LELRKILLDTSAYSWLMSGDTRVLDIIDNTRVLFMSTVVLGELFAGFRGGTRYKANVAKLKDFLSDPLIEVMQVSESTAEMFGQIKHALKVAGTPLPINDIWIAAHAMEAGAVIVTYDTHLSRLPSSLLRLSKNLTNESSFVTYGHEKI